MPLAFVSSAAAGGDPRGYTRKDTISNPPLSWIVAFESITFLGSNYLDPKRSANFWQHFPSRELKSTLYWQGFAINTMRKDARP